MIETELIGNRMDSLQIKSGQGNYNVDFLDDIDALIQVIQRMPGIVLLIDRNIVDLYSDFMMPLVDSKPTLQIDATEEEKTLAGVTRALEFLQNSGCVKQSILVAIGGGIIQDIATFAAHVYYRGIKFVYVPTTLLAMSDSCIGAKCCINLNAYKNQIGAFHSPSKVLICHEFLGTLSDTDIRSGYGEIFKLLLTGPVGQFNILAKYLDEQGFQNQRLVEFIYQSLTVKKGVIEVDEYEADLRRILNYGHTFGHSLEAVTQYEIPHGLAIAWGIDVANFIAFRRGILSESDFSFIHAFASRHFSYRVSRPLLVAELIRSARRDKKVSGGKVNMALLERPGKLTTLQIAFDEWLEKDITEYLSLSNIVYWD